MQNKVEMEPPPRYDDIAPTAIPVTHSVPSYISTSAMVKGVPPQLQSLLQINQLCIQEKFTASQGWGRSFDVLDQMGQRLYQAIQNVQCCGPMYDLKVHDNAGHSVLEVTEHCGCRCSRQMEVIVPSIGLIGSANLNFNMYVTHLSLLSPSKDVILLILGPSFQTNIFGNVTFEVKSRDEQHVLGMIKSEGNTFTITFPMDLEVTMKAMVLAASFYLDSLIYSRRSQVANRPSSD